MGKAVLGGHSFRTCAIVSLMVTSRAKSNKAFSSMHLSSEWIPVFRTLPKCRTSPVATRKFMVLYRRNRMKARTSICLRPLTSVLVPVSELSPLTLPTYGVRVVLTRSDAGCNISRQVRVTNRPGVSISLAN